MSKRTYFWLIISFSILLSGCGGSSANRLGKFPADNTSNFYVTVSPAKGTNGDLLKYLKKISPWQEADLANKLHYYGYGVKELHGENIIIPPQNAFIVKVTLQTFIQGRHVPFVGSRAEVAATYQLLDSQNNIILSEEYNQHSARGWAPCVQKMSREFIETIRKTI